MYYNTIIKSNIQKLENLGVKFCTPVLEEDKAKVAPIDLVLSQIISTISIRDTKITPIPSQAKVNWNFFCKNETNELYDIKEKCLLSYFSKKKIIISVGSTIEYIDPIRIISNTSSGKMGFSLINQALNYGLDVTVVKGVTQIDEKFREFSVRDNNRPQLIEAKTTDQMAEAITGELKRNEYDIVILAAAVSDFKPSMLSDKKISTDNASLQLKLAPTIKIVDKVKHIQKDTFLVAFKAEYRVGDQNLLTRSWQKLTQSRADLIIANDIGLTDPVIGSDLNKIFALDKEQNYFDFPLQKKNRVAEGIFKLIYMKLYRDRL
jgi:phosphopantothenoylcysteine decarboxylase/phosphopantothenate--cysteine ligase